MRVGCPACIARSSGWTPEQLVVSLLGAIMVSPARLHALLDGLCEPHRKAARLEAAEFSEAIDRSWRGE